MRQHRQKKQGDDVGDLDHRVHSRAGRVLVGVADGVAGHGRLVGLRALSAVVAVLDVLLGIVPGAAAGRHRDGDEQAVDDHTEKHGTERREGFALAADPQDDEEGDDRREHRQQRRHDHLADRGAGEQVDRLAVVRLVGALHDAGLFLELPPHLLDDGAGRTTDRRHGDAAEEIGQQAAKQQAGDDVGIGQREVDLDAREERELRRVRREVRQVRGIGREQHQRAEAGGADGIALGHRLGGVADRVERVGGLAHLGRQVGHLGDAAGIVGDRAEGVERHDHARQSQHGGDRDGDAVEAGEIVGGQDAGDDDDRRQRRRLERDREALDDVGAVAGDRGLGDRLHRTVLGAGVVLGDPHDQAGDDQADDAAEEQAQAGEGLLADGDRRAEAEDQPGDQRQAHDRKQRGGNEALVEGAHDPVIGAELDEEHAADRGQDADRGDGQRVHHAGGGEVAEQDRAENHGGDHGHRIGLEQVGRHAGAVADIVADVVGDGRRIARIVLGNAGLDLADEVAADVSTLGEDAAAETGEDRDQRSAEAERHQRVDDDAVGGGMAEELGEDQEIDADAEQSQAGNQHAGDRARAEGDGKTRRQALGRSLRGARIGAYRDHHADEAGRTGEDGADQEADADGDRQEPGDDDEHHDADRGNGGVLATQIGSGAFLHGGRYLLHASRTGVRSQHVAGRPCAIGDGDQPTQNDQVNHGFFPPSAGADERSSARAPSQIQRRWPNEPPPRRPGTGVGMARHETGVKPCIGSLLTSLKGLRGRFRRRAAALRRRPRRPPPGTPQLSEKHRDSAVPSRPLNRDGRRTARRRPPSRRQENRSAPAPYSSLPADKSR